jgi:hypothetical protein
MIINNIDALVLLLGALGASGTPMASQARPIDACSLLQPSEISAAIGLPIEEGVRRDEGLVPQGAYSSACMWAVKQDASARKSFVIVNAMQWPTDSGLADTFLEAFRRAAASGEIASQPVPRELGDAALWWGDGLALRRGDVSVGISVFVPGLKAQHADYAGYFEERLAVHILQRLEARE